MPKDFFVYELDEVRNVCVCNNEQRKFIKKYYPKYDDDPIELLMELYDAALERDQNYK
jgi:hypothetical protein